MHSPPARLTICNIYTCIDYDDDNDDDNDDVLVDVHMYNVNPIQ